LLLLLLLLRKREAHTMGGLFSYFMGEAGPIPTVNPADEERYTLPLGPCVRYGRACQC
jgi:hypothetical protein